METERSARGVRLMIAVIILTGALGMSATIAWADPSEGQTRVLRVGDVTFEFVRIPAGRFLMGSSSGSRDEKPAHEVTLTNELYLGRTEVTVRQFRAFAEATGYKTDAERMGWAHTCPLPGMHPHERGLNWRRPGFEPNDNHPAVVLSHDDAMALCRWLSERTGQTCRLPTEAEWEYAARAGRQDDPTDSLRGIAWYEENTSDSPYPVGTKAQNPWGLCDMQGNAWEWCLDVWRPDYQSAALDGRPQVSDPTIPPAIWRHVLRGGGWASPKEHLRYSYRQRGLASFASPATGFRVALDAQGRIIPARDVKAAPGAARACPREGGQGAISTDSQTGKTTLTTHGVPFEFVRVPAGEFLMGMEEGSIEKPVHKVRIGCDFEMAQTEVTVAQFRAFVEATGYMTDGEKSGTGGARRDGQDWMTEEEVSWRDTGKPQSDEHPASFISWYDAMAFCHWLSAETGQEIRLPSEAQWEYACRAGTTGAYAGAVNGMGWHRYNSGGRTHPVAQKQPNAWGLYDMHGNVWEWCLDFFTTSYEGAPTDGRPRWDLKPASDVVSRGGSFANPPGWLGSAVRMGSFPDCSHYNNGFRIVRVLKSSETPAPSKPSGSTARSTSAQAGPATPKLVPVESARDLLKLNVEGVAFELVRVPAGVFRMGSEEGDSDERPVHEVRIERDFYLGKTEVTVAQFEVFCKARGYLLEAEVERWLGRRQREAGLFRPWVEKGFTESGDHPAVCVRWHNAVAFCRWLSERTGRQIRLPSEAEWEYAGRAGTTGEDSRDLDEVAWHAGNSDGASHPVATKKPNAWGLYGMRGNVWEWCEDVYHRNYEGAPVDGSAWTAGIDSRRVMRGGGWSGRFGPPAAPAAHLRSAYRFRLPPEYRDPAVGFRMVCEIESGERAVPSHPQASPEAATRTEEKAPVPRDKMPLAFIVDSADFEFVHVPPGESDMGSETGAACERPVHRVRLEQGFDMAATEVTVWQFMAFTQATGYLTDVEKDGRAWDYRDGTWEGAGIDWFKPGFEQSGDNPVVCITWYDATAFCQWLSQKTGWEIRLPTEAEWEYACRAGTMGEHAGDVDALGWHGYNSSLRTHPVGTKRPNGWGLYDMHGNAWEWCADNWHENYEGAPANGTPWSNAANTDHVLRGGAWCRNPWVCRSAYRYHAWPDCSSVNIGFRIARTCAGDCSRETDASSSAGSTTR